MKQLSFMAKAIFKGLRSKGFLRKVALILACVVSFGTTYALILPMIWFRI